MKPFIRWIGLAVLGQIGFLSAAPIPGLYNTGVNDAGELLGPSGVVDPHYKLTTSDDVDFPGLDLVTINQVWPVAPAGPWLADGPLSRWISPSASTNVAAGSYTYTTTFDLTGYDHETARIEIKWASDDGGQIVLNGTVVASGGGFGGWSQKVITHDPDSFVEFFPGENVLEFVINNSASGPSGLRVEMNGFVEVANEPPSIRVQPPPMVSVFEGEPISITAIADGTPPLTYQWKRNGQELPGQTFETLDLPGTPEDSGEYTLVVTNAHGSVTSQPVRVYIVEPLPGLYPTGVDDQGQFLDDWAIDPHYRLVENPDTGVEEATVMDTQVFPIVDGPWVNTQEFSKWIGPQADTNGSAAGDYVYRVTFDLTGYDPASVLIEMEVTSDNALSLRVNGTATTVSAPGAFGSFTALSLRAGVEASFLPGVNTLDFVVNNATPGPTGLNVASLRVGAVKGAVTALPPSVLRHPDGVRTLQGKPVVLEVVADGTAPLAFQWRKDGQPLAGKTGPRLELETAQASDSGEYSVVVTNNLGEVVSRGATVLVVPPIPGVILNTGLDTTGQLLEDGAEDPHYELIAAPDGWPTGPSYAVFDPPYPAWYMVEDDSAHWIGPGPSVMAPPGDYVFQLKLDLTGYDPDTIIIMGRWAADNSGTLRLNGVPAGMEAGGFNGPLPFSLSRGFVAGVNILEFRINNAGDADNPAGFLVTDVEVGGMRLPTAPEPPVAMLTPQPDGRIKVSYAPVAGWKPYISSTLQEGSWTDATALFTADGAVMSVIANPSELKEAYLRFHYEP